MTVQSSGYGTTEMVNINDILEWLVEYFSMHPGGSKILQNINNFYLFDMVLNFNPEGESRKFLQNTMLQPRIWRQLCSSENLVSTCMSTWHYNPKDQHLTLCQISYKNIFLSCILNSISYILLCQISVPWPFLIGRNTGQGGHIIIIIIVITITATTTTILIIIMKHLKAQMPILMMRMI